MNVVRNIPVNGNQGFFVADTHAEPIVASYNHKRKEIRVLQYLKEVKINFPESYADYKRKDMQEREQFGIFSTKETSLIN